MQELRIKALATATFVAAVAACSAPGSTPPPGGAPNNGSSGTNPNSSQDAGPVSLPFVVSDEFFPSGFMGDSPTDFNAIQASSDASKCPARVAGAVGSCYSFTWTPQRVGDAGSSWVGVYWQYPSNNWGAQPGLSIKPGATKVTFTAAAKTDGVVAKFISGGVNYPIPTAGIANADTYESDISPTLTTSWQPFEISLSGDSYTSVIGGFAWSITTSSTDPITFYVDNIQWENTPDDAGE
jgi:hypothetical protein